MKDPFGSLDRGELALLTRAPHPTDVRPGLATLVGRVPDGPEWLFERKLDGIRCIASRDGDEVELRSRSGRGMAAGFPEIADAIRAMDADDVVIDGEIVAFDGPRTSFERLQPRMLVQHATPRFKGIVVHFYVFDLLYADGHDLRSLPLRRRKIVLKQALDYSETVRFTQHRNGGGAKLLTEARRLGWEGLVAKRADSAYPRGRSRDWLKIKIEQSQELVIGGWTDPDGSRQHFGALLVGYYDDAGRLVYAGRVGSGFSDAVLQTLAAGLAERSVAESPFDRGSPPKVGVHWVRPDLVGQVGFGEWTREGLLRHPRFHGLRTDKAARDVVREAPA